MTEKQTVALTGCTPIPLAGYLKALGVLRLVTDQVDKNACGWWSGEVFNLKSSLSQEELLRFFVDKYVPTPIIAPWNGGSGFFPKDQQDAVTAIVNSPAERLLGYRETIQTAKDLMMRFGILEKQKDEQKGQLMQLMRNHLSDRAIQWLDAAVLLTSDDPKYPPLLGTGGNIGRLEFTNNFMQNLVRVVDTHSGIGSANSLGWLQAALFDQVTHGMVKASVGQFAPGQSGGPNSRSGFDGDSLVNPWDFILMLEGAVVFASASSKRLSASSRAALSFPFTVRASGVGNGSTAKSDESSARAEMWMPLWERAVTLAELTYLFREGRVQLRRNNTSRFQRSRVDAADGVDFARAIATLAVDRGIQSFQRYSFMQRAGQSYLAVPLTRFAVRRREQADLLDQLDPWLSSLRKYASEKGVPDTYGSALRRIRQRMFELCEQGGSGRLLPLLIELARVEQLLVHNESGRASISPLMLNDPEWLLQSFEPTPEWAIAVALASLQQGGNVAQMRAYLSPVHPDHKHLREWDKNVSPRVVWQHGDTSANMVRILERRFLDASMGADWSQGDKSQVGFAEIGFEKTHEDVAPSDSDKPLISLIGVRLSDVQAFLDNANVRKRVGELLWAFLPLAAGGAVQKASKQLRKELRNREKVSNFTAIPWVYAVGKLLYTPDSMLNALRRKYNLSEDTIVPIPPGFIRRLSANHLGEASRMATHRLRASGLQSRFDEVHSTGIVGIDCAAALLIPLALDDTEWLGRHVFKKLAPPIE